MPKITLPDGQVLDFKEPITGFDVASAIGEGLARAALAMRVDGELLDVFRTIESDAKVSFITARDQEGLEVIRHSCAHVLAQAAKRLFPEIQVTIGPVIEDGFYYDFAFERSFTPEDVAALEKEMKRIIKENLQVSRKVVSRDDAIKTFEAMGEHYKVQIIKDLPEDETITLYAQGDFVDLCRGPHVPSTNKIKAFKLTKLAGAYWRGDSNNEMLQRVYGTAWADKDALAAYLKRIEEAEKRDHRRLGKRLNLFHLQEEAPGMVFWHPDGWTLYRTIQEYLREKLERFGYQEIRTPQLVDLSLWKASGHWEKFQEEMFVTETENHVYAIKPMNCPCHVQVYKQGLKSYRDLPLRLAEYGSCHRSEPSGALHGLMRVRHFVQDDAHIFCTHDQIQQEVLDFIDLVFTVYKDFGFDDISMKLSTRPDKRVGSDEVWDKAELALQQALETKGVEWQLQPGEGAFYGPKIEFSLRDCLGREWQCGTMQVDFSMPERLGAEYIAEDNTRQVPVMLHRAVFGSFERFIGVLIEHYAGALPTWLAPCQMVVMNISEKHEEYVQKVTKMLSEAGIRVRQDLRNEKIGYKIREHTLQHVPYQIIVGDHEVAQSLVAVRTCAGDDLGTMTVAQLLEHVEADVASLGRQRSVVEQQA